MKSYIKWLSLFILTLIWGSSFILIKKGLQEFSPYQVGALRMIIASVSLLLIGGYRLKEIPKSLWKWIILCGFLGSFFPMFLFPLAETQVESAIAGVLNALTPLFVFIFGLFFFKARYTKINFLGLLISFSATIALIVIPNLNQSSSAVLGKETSIPHALLIVFATFLYAISSLIYKKKLTGFNQITITTAVFSTLLIPGILVLISTGFFTQFHATTAQNHSLFFVFLLGFMGSGVAMLLYNRLIQSSTAIFASSVTYLMPMVSLMWGIQDGEQIQFFHLICFALILIGVYLINYKKKAEN